MASAIASLKTPRSGSRPDVCSHPVDPTMRFTAPGEWPQVAHCNACGATVEKSAHGAPWAVQPAQMVNTIDKYRTLYGSFKGRQQ